MTMDPTIIPDLKGKSVLITGASTGIGAALARALAPSGCRIAIHYNASVNRAEEVAADVRFAGGEAFLVGGDFTSSTKAREVVTAAATSLDLTYDGLNATDVSVTNLDNEAVLSVNDMYVWDILWTPKKVSNSRYDLGVNVRRQRHIAHMDLEDLLAPANVGVGHHDLAVEPAGAQQRRVQHVGPVGRGDQDDALIGLEAVHLDQELVQRLLALVIAAA